MEDVATTVEVGSYLDHLIAGHSDLDVHEPVFIYICAATGQTVEESDRCNNSGDLAHTYALRRVFDGHDWEICPRSCRATPRRYLGPGNHGQGIAPSFRRQFLDRLAQAGDGAIRGTGFKCRWHG